MLPKGLLKEYSGTLSLSIRVIDAMIIFTAGWIASYLRFDSWVLSSDYVVGLFVSMAVATVIFSFFHIYTSVRGKGLLSHFITLVQAVAVLALILAGVAFLTKSGELFSRIWFGVWMLTALFMLVTYPPHDQT